MAIPPQFLKKKQAAAASAQRGQAGRNAGNTDPNGPDAQDKKVGALHKGAHQANKAQRNAVFAAGKKGKVK